MPQITSAEIQEFQSAAGTTPRIDREKGILFDVKFLGEKSDNPPPDDNLYPKQARAALIPILEGARINIDHPPRTGDGDPRPYGDGAGVARNIAERGEGLYGEAHFNPHHPNWPQICWDAKNCPEHLAFSIHAHGNFKRVAEGRQLQSWNKLYSVDLVSKGGTNKSIYESKQERPKMKKTIREVLRNALTGKGRQILEMEVPAEMISAEMEEPAAAEGEPELTAEEKARAAFREMVIAAFDDSSLDLKATVARIKTILENQAKMLGEESIGAAEGDKPAETPKETAEMGQEEEKKKDEEVTESLRRQIRARDLCDAEGVVPNKVLKAALASAETETEMSDLIREHKQSSQAATTPAKTQSGLPIRDSQRQNGVPEKPEELAAWLRS